MTTPADELRVIRLQGTDRLSFLQGQLTQDTSLLSVEHPLLTGWTTAKGRLRCLGWLVDWQDSCWLILPGSLIADISQQLKMYVLRADVQIDCPDIPLAVKPRASVEALIPIDVLPNNKSIGDCYISGKLLLISLNAIPDYVLVLGEVGGGETAQPDWSEWRYRSVLAGIPSVWPQTSDSFIPQMLNLDLLAGISFSKGCYVGQEIVARTQNLGRIKRRMYRFSCATNLAPAPGAAVYSDGSKVATVVDAVAQGGHTELLVVVPMDKLPNPLTLDAEGKLKLDRCELPYLVPEQLN
jgi:folate-binding protein YgfZ